MRKLLPLIIGLALLVWIILSFWPQEAEPTVVVNKPLAEENFLNETEVQPKTKMRNLPNMPGQEKEIPLSELNKPINKLFGLADLKTYFATANLEINEKKYQPVIVKFKAEKVAAEKPMNGQSKTFEQVTQAASTPKMRTEYEVFYEIDNKGGSRVLEEKTVQKQVWQEKAQATERQKRIVQIDLPRRFENFSLGEVYKGKDMLTWNSPESSMLESVEGRMFRSQMYYFVLNFSPKVDAYYLAAVLQDVFSADADFRKVGSTLVFNWDDNRTKIEYIIYPNDRCRLHFYDIDLGRQKIRSQ